MALNPLGAVWANDFGAPKVLSGRVFSNAISGGQMVTVSGLVNVVSSGLDSFVTSDLQFVAGTTVSGANFVGIALGTAGSNQPLAVAVEGLFILQAATIVSGGTVVAAIGDNSVASTILAGHGIGRALTNAGSEGFAVVYIK